MDILNIIWHLLLFVSGIFLLAKSSNFVIITITRVGHELRISEFITGFVILGVATSFPEIFIGITSAIDKIPELSLGNLLGADVVLLTLIAGIAAISASGIYVKQELGNKLRAMQVGLLIFCPMLFLWDSYLSRWDGIILIGLYLGYNYFLYKSAPNNSPPLKDQLLNHRLWHSVVLAVVGFVGLIISSKMVVTSSLAVSAMFHVAPVVVGTLILGLGTNLPEMALVWAAIRKRHKNLVIGDVLGSAATNTFIVGMLGVLSPFKISNPALYLTLTIYMGISIVTFFMFSRSSYRLTRLEGVGLLSLYVSSVITQLFVLNV